MATAIKQQARKEALRRELASDEAAGEPGNPRERIGGNEPPPEERIVHVPTPEEISASLKVTQRAALAEITKLANRCKKLTAPIETEDQAKTAQDTYKDLHGALKDWNGTRVAEKEPYLAAERAVDSYFQAVRERGNEVLAALNAVLAEFLQRKEAAKRAKREAEAARARAEEEKRRREAAALAEKERQEREALQAAEREQRTKDAAKLRRQVDATQEKRLFADEVADGSAINTRAAEARATAPSAELARTRGDSSLGTLRKEFDFVIENADAIPLEELRPFLKIDAIEQAVRAMVRVHGDRKPLAGVRIFEDKKANVR